MPERLTQNKVHWVKLSEGDFINMENVERVCSSKEDSSRLIVWFTDDSTFTLKKDSIEARRILYWLEENSQAFS